MDDYKIALGALLDANAKGDIDKQLNAIKDLSVTISKATLSNDVINDIKRQLTQNGIDLKLVFGNVDQITSQAKQTGQQIGKQIQNGINDAIQKGNSQRDFFFSAEKKNSVAKQAQEYFRGISNGVVTVTEQMENLDDKSELRGFIVNIKNAKGEVESLKYSLRNILDDDGNVTGQKFAYVSGSINDAGAIKQFEELNKVITDYEIKLANLKTKYSNMNVDYSAFNGVFDNFKLGIGTTNDLALAFNQLENSSKKAVQSLKSQTSSFDPIQQTLNNMRDLPSMLTALESNMSGVKDKTSIAEISVDKLRESFYKLDAEMQPNGGKVPITDEWLKNYRDLMSTVTSATKQVDALKKAEASDNSQTQKQANYYSTILSNYREIYSLKKKLLTAGDEETKVIQEQIRSINSSNASINKQLGKQGLKDNNWQTQVDDLKKELDYSLRISEAHQKDKATQSNLNDAQKESIKIIKDLETSYQRIQDIKVKIASLDKEKDSKKISTLSQEEKTAKEEYTNLYNKLRKRKNYDKESWNETKSAIDAATKSQIEFNNAKSQDTLNRAHKTEVSNFNILKSKWEEQGILVGDFKKKVEDMESLLSSVGSKGELDNLKLQIKDLKTEASQIADVDKIQLSFANGDYEAKVESTIAKTQQWHDENGNARISTEQLRTALVNLGTAYNNLNADGGDTIANQKALKQAESELSVEIKKVTNDVTKMNAEYAKSSKVESLHQKLTEFYDKNSATHKKWGTELKQMMDATASGAKVTNSELINMERRFTQIGNEARQTGKLGLSFFDGIKEQAKKFTQWVSVTSVVMEGVQTLRKMKDAVYEIDTAMTSLYKVTDETDIKYNEFLNGACDNAQRLGRSVSSLVEQTANWAKLGYGIDDASKLAEISSIYANVGEVDDATAVSDIVTAIKAFNIEANNSIEVVDKLNNLGNKYATSSADLGEGLSKSASALALAGNDINKTLAMLTGGTEITQNASEMGNSLKVLSMRIRGMKGELEKLGEEYENVESISKIQTQILNQTKGAVNIFDDAGNFRATYDILKDIAEVWDKISQVDQSALLETIAGKQRGNQISALIQSFQSGQAQKAYADAVNSAGSAMQEQERWMQSLEAKTQQFEAAFQSLSNTVLDSDLLKFFVDLGTTGVKAIDGLVNALGSLGTIGVIGGGILGAKNAGIFKTITDESTLSGQRIVSSLQARKIAQEEAARQLEVDIQCLKKYEIECQKGNVSTETFAKTMDGASVSAQKYAANIKDGTGSAQTFATNQRVIQSSMNETSVVSKLAATGLNLFKAALSSFVFFAVIEGIQLLVKGIDNLILTAEEAEEKAESLRNSMQSFFDEVQSGQQTISSISDRFSELSKHVTKTGENIDLTKDEYSEYLDICNQVKSIMPELVTGYTNEGNAIITLKDNVDSLTESYKENVRAKAAAFVTNGDDDGNTIQSFFDDYKIFTEGEGGLFAPSAGGLWNNKSTDYEDYYGYDKIHEWLSEVADLSLKDLQNLQKGTTQATYLYTLLKENGYELANITEDNYEAVHDVLDTRLTSLEGEIATRVSNVKMSLQQMLYADRDYWDIDNKEALSAIDSLFSSVDAEFIKQNNLLGQTALQSFESNVIRLFNDKNTQQAMIDIYVPQGIEESIEDYSKRVNNAIKNIQDYAKENKIDISLDFGDITGDVENLQKQYNDAIAKAKDKELDFDWNSWFKENSINTQEEIDRWNEIAESATNAADARKKYTEGEEGNETDILSKNLDDLSQKTSEFAKSIRNDMKEIESSLQKLSKGNFKSSDLFDLLEKYPDLDLSKVNLTTFEGLRDVLNNLKVEKLKEFTSSLEKIGYDEQTISKLKDMLLQTEDATVDLETEFSNLQKKAKLVYSASNDINSSLQDILSTYPELEKQMIKYQSGLITEKQLFESLQELYEKDANNYRNLLVFKSENDELFYNNVINNLPSWVDSLAKSYGLDLANYKTLIDAKNELDNKRLRNMNRFRQANAMQGLEGFNDDPQRYISENKDINSIIKALYDGGRKSNIEFTSWQKLGSIGNTSKDTSKKEITKSDFDFIEIKLNKLNEALDKQKEKADDVTKSYKTQRNEIENVIDLIDSQKKTYDDAYSNYINKANSTKLSDSIKKKVRNGEINISSYDSDTIDAINEYKKWYDKAQEIKEYIYELDSQKDDYVSKGLDLQTKGLEDTKNKYQSQFNNYEAKIGFGNITNKEKISYLTKQLGLLEKIHIKDIEIAKANGATKEEIESINLEYEKTKSNIDSSIRDVFNNTLTSAIDLQKKSVSFLEDELSLREKIGDTITEADYDIIIQKEQLIKSNYESLLKSAQDHLSTLSVGTDAWCEQYKVVFEYEELIQECNMSLNEMSETIRNLKWENFQKGMSSLSNFTNEYSDIKKLLGDNKINDDGSLTNDGLSYIALLGKDINVYKAEIESYQSALSEIKRLMDNSTNKSEYEYYSDLYNKYVQAMRDSASNLKTAQDEIVSIKTEQIEAQAEATSKLIDEQIALYEAEKKEYELSKEKVKSEETLARLKAKAALLEANTNAQDRTNAALLAKIKNEIALKEKDAEEKAVEDSYDNKIDNLNKQKDAIEKSAKNEIKTIKSSQSEQEKIVSNSLDNVKNNYSSVLSNISDISSKYGIILSDNLTSPWISAQSEVQKYMDIVSLASTGFTSDSSNKIQDILNSANGKGNGTSALNQSMQLSGYNQLSYNQMAQLSNEMFGTNYTGKDMVNNTEAKNSILNELEANGYITTSLNDRIMELIKNGSGSGANSSELNQYLLNKYGKALSYKQQAEMARLLGLGNYTEDDMKKNKELKNKILSKLVLTGFSKGGSATDIVSAFNNQIKLNGDTGLATIKRGESILTPERTKILENWTKILENWNDRFIPQMADLLKVKIPDFSYLKKQQQNQSVNVEKVVLFETLGNANYTDEILDKSNKMVKDLLTSREGKELISKSIRK